jgi:death-on-curing protein
MNAPNWVDRQVLIAIQSELLNRFGGLAGIRDEGLLDSAINKPKNLFAYGQPTVFELAA